MALDEDFRVQKKIQGGKTTVQVNKVSAILVALPRAMQDLEDMISNKTILNPHGTMVMNRNSSSSILKEYDGTNGDIVVAGLRQIAGVSMISTHGGGSQSNKRKADEDDSAEAQTRDAKRRRVVDF
jgi:predicted heme/steroid binding protein